MMQPIILILLLALVYSHPLQAANEKTPEQVQAELQALEDEITKFRKMLESTQGERSKLERNLEGNEKAISDIIKRIESMKEALNKGEDKLSSLSIQQRKLQADKVAQQDKISQQVRAAFELGKQPYLKVVLNQQDPNKLSRMVNYYDYFNQARLAEISQYETTLEQLKNIGEAINQQNAQLKSNRLQLQQERDGLLAVQSENKQVLAALVREIAETGTLLDKRLADREQLEQLMTSIAAGITNLSAPADARPFAEMKGNLLLPVAGKISQKFGNRRSDGKLRWNGVFIAADEGEPVHAVHYGRVVFSDWLRGFGLLIIVSHGEGFMSLYGHNQVLYRQAGDWVSAGDMIANVGNTGGQQEYGLYFEIRSAGKPSDPQLWCSARPANKTA